MFDNIRKIFRTKQKNVSVNQYHSITPSWRNIHAFAKGQDFENAYPHIARIAAEFMTIRPYGIDSNGKTVSQSRVLDAIYHPNQEMSSADFREALAVMLLVKSKVFLLCWREENGRAVAGGEITTENLVGFTFLENPTEFWIGEEKRYRVGTREYSTSEVIELRGGINPYNLSDGYSPMVASRKWASLDDYIAAYQAGFFENGAIPAGEFVIVANTAEEFNEIVDTMQNKHRGSGRNNNVIYTHAPIDAATGKPAVEQIRWVPYATNNNQLGMKELFEQANQKIDSAFGVPASVRGVNENNTYASVRIDEQIFLKYTVKPFALRIWTRFTHELNRITGGLGFAITFEMEEVGVADEEKAKADRKAVELGIIEKGLNLGYSLDSIVDAFELSVGYKTLEISEKPAVIENDKPEVDEGGEVASSPNQSAQKIAQKSECEHCHCQNCGGEHCLKVKIAQKVAPDDPNIVEVLKIEQALVNLVEKRTEEALKSQKAGGTSKILKLTSDEILRQALNILARAGQDQYRVGIGILAKNDVDFSGATSFTLGERVKIELAKQILANVQSFDGDTNKTIERILDVAKSEDWDKEQLARTLRNVKNTDEWRIQRFARTESHKYEGLGGVEAMVQLQNETDTRIFKEWYTVSDDPCPFCKSMNGKRVNVAESYLRQGGIVVGKSAVRVNDYEDIETAAMHPNCSCREKFSVETGEKAGDGEKDAWKRIEVKELPKKLYTEVYGENWKEFSFDRNEPLNSREKQVAQILTQELGAKIYALRRVEKPDGVKTPDLLLNGDKFEIKEVRSLRAVEDQLRKAKKQIGKNGGIVYDLMNDKITAEEYIQTAEKRTKMYGVSKMVIVSDDKVVYKKNM